MTYLSRTTLSLAILSVMTSQASFAATIQSNEAPAAQLDTLTVSLDRQGAKIQTDVVTLQEKDESTATTLRELMKSDPAIDFGNGNGTSQYITIRGMGQNSIDVKVDNAYSDSSILYHQGRFMLDPSMVKIVGVQKGAGAASAGIGATNGAIIAKTLDAHDLLKEGQSLGFKVNTGYSSNDEISYGGVAYGKTGAFDFLLSANKVDQENYTAGKGYKNYLGGDEVPSSALDKTGVLAKIGVDASDDQRIVLSHFNETNKGVRNVREEFDIFSATVNPRLTIDRQKPTYRELSLSNTNLEWTGKNMGFIKEATANIYNMENKRKSNDDQGGYGAVAGYNETAVKTKGANINFDSKILPNTLVKYGVNYRHQEIEPNRHGSNFSTNTKKTDTGVYVEAIHDINNFTLTAGGRYDHFDYTAVDGKARSDGAFSPSLGVIYQATPALSLSANHSYATRSPRLVDALLSGNSTVSIADDAEAEKARNTEIGFNYNVGSYFVNGSYFWQKINDLLANGQTDRHNPTDSNIDNVGYAKNHGWELNAGYDHNNLKAHVGVADSNPEFYTDPGKVACSSPTNCNPISFASKEFGVKMGRTWTAGLAYRFNQPNIEVGFNHRLVEDTVGVSAWMGDTEANRSLKREGFNVTDIFANWKPYNSDKMNVNVAINNIANKDYRPHTAMSLPAVGREFRIGVNYTF